MTSSEVDWLNVSRETLERLREFEALVVKWSGAINLVSRNSVQVLWGRHLLDSAQIALLAPKAPAQWTDLGSGGGFPGIVAAIQLKELSPQTHFVLVESDERKATFLREVVRLLDLNAAVQVRRIEGAAPGNAEVVTARALGPLVVLLDYARAHLLTTGRAFFPKGRTFQEELHQAGQAWRFRVVIHPSRTDPRSAILEIDQIDKK